jgi:hypothetical protein
MPMALVVSQDAKKRKLELENGKSITIMPWRTFLMALWAGDIV